MLTRTPPVIHVVFGTGAPDNDSRYCLRGDVRADLGVGVWTTGLPGQRPAAWPDMMLWGRYIGGVDWACDDQTGLTD